MGDEVSVSGADGGGGGADPGVDAAELYEPRDHDSEGARGEGSRARVRVVSADPERGEDRTILEGGSSRLLQQEFAHLKKRYWGQHLWARGYFCATVGEVTTELIREYIEKHDEESPPENFSIHGT